MKTIIIIQARIGSSRLPGKVLMPLGGTVVLDYVVERCKQVHDVDKVVVATSTLKQDDVIARWCQQHHVPYFRGSEEDVLSRYYECAKRYEPDFVIRVTADCPFVDYDFANDIVEAMRKKPADIVIVNGQLPRGLVVEMVSFSALAYMHKHGQENRHREHVTYYAYEFPEQFQQTFIDVPKTMQQPQLRVTLDTEEDYALCQAVANHFQGDVLVRAQNVVQFLLDHPEVAKLNAHVQQKPVV